MIGMANVVERRWADGKVRCSWANPANPAYIAYHDSEWGVATHDDQELFEMLVLECFQAGLSWECILNKRPAFRAAFEGFDVDAVCAFGQAKVDELMQNAGIVRNRRKIEAAITNARVFRSIQSEFGNFAHYIWDWTDGETIHETGRATSPLSDAVSRDLKARGMKFVGSTVIYAYLQAIGVISAHEEGCFLHRL